jgi:GntR family transcriptional regulator/MocR family aminotransferase
MRSAIEDGRLPPGSRLPSTREFALLHRVSRNTAVAIYELLLSEGYLSSHPRSGSYVSTCPIRTMERKHPAGEGNERRIAAPWRSVSCLAEQSAAHVAHDLRLGVPDLSNFPWDIWRRLEARVLRAMSQSRAAYQPPAGVDELRTAIARHVAHTRAVSCGPEDVIVTSGAQQAFDLIGRILVSPGETVAAVEGPGYAGLKSALVAAGAETRPVAVDVAGICVSQLPVDAGIICVTPSHQFPTSVVMTYDRRLELLDFARQRNAVIVEDDYDAEFRYTDRPLDALQTLDRNDSVFYVGTFSKSMFPALRLGFIVAPPWARSSLTAAKQLADWHSPAATQLALADFIGEGHLARHIRKMRRIYGERRRALLNGIGEMAMLRVLPSAAGLHVGAEVADSISIEEFLDKARERGVAIDGWNAIRTQRPAGLSFGYGQIEVARIAKALRLISEFLN